MLKIIDVVKKLFMRLCTAFEGCGIVFDDVDDEIYIYIYNLDSSINDTQSNKHFISFVGVGP